MFLHSYSWIIGAFVAGFTYYLLAKITFRQATVLSAMSKEYIEWIYKFSGRKINNKDLIIPLTSKIRENSQRELLQAEKWWKQYGVDQTVHFEATSDWDIIANSVEEVADGLDCPSAW